jgi:hypothetical protein
MRPTGEVTNALLAAAGALASPGHGGTLREITALACVGRQVAAYTIPKLAARGHLEVVADRRVDYRNRPVFEYGLAPQPSHAGDAPARADLASLQATSGRERMPEPPDTPTTWSNFV